MTKLRPLFLSQVLLSCCVFGTDSSAVRFLDPIGRIQPGPNAGTVQLLLRVDAQTSTQKAIQDLPTFTDHQLPAGLAANVQQSDFTEVTPTGDAGRTWQINLRVMGLDANTMQRRYATITWAGQSKDLAYQLSNQPAADFKWDVSGLPTEWNLKTDRCISFRTSQSAPVTTGILLGATLVEDSSKELLGPPDLYLTANPSGHSSQDELDNATNAAKTIYLCADESLFKDWTAHGKFTGTVTVASVQKTDGKTLALTAYQTGTILRSVGLLLLIFGTATAYFIQVYAPAKVARGRELEAISLLRTEIERVEKGILRIPKSKVPLLDDSVRELLATLSLSSLEARNFIHPLVPGPFATETDGAGFAQVLSDSSLQVARIQVVLRDGLMPVKDLESKFQPMQALIDEAYTTMSSRVNQSPAPTVDQLHSQVLDDLDQLRQKLQNAALAPNLAAHLAVPPEPSQLSLDRIQFSIATISGTVWFLFALATIVSGAVYLIWTNLSFGRPVDYLACFFWGFGLTAGSQQITTGAIKGAFGITVLK